MSSIDQKFQILESLDSLDYTQTRQVLDYIKGLQARSNETQQRIKREGMLQIRQALSKSRMRNASF